MVGAQQALMVGGTIEEKDMVDIQDAIERSDHADIDLVYQSCCADRAITCVPLRRQSWRSSG